MRTGVRPSSSQETGATLVEALMVLGLAVSFIVGSLFLYTAVREQSNRDQLVRDVIGVIAEVRMRYAGGNYPANINVERAPRNPWGGRVAVRGASNGNLEIVFDRMPSGSCEAVVRHLKLLSDNGIAIGTVAQAELIPIMQGSQIVGWRIAFNIQNVILNGLQGCRSEAQLRAQLRQSLQNTLSGAALETAVETRMQNYQNNHLLVVAAE